MSQIMSPAVCCIAGCSRPACDDGLRLCDEALCAQHAQAGAPALVARLRTAFSRRDRVDRLWADPQLYDSIVESGRYLKLCDATQAVMDQADAAWIRLKLDLVVNDANRGARRFDQSNPGSAAVAS